MNSQIKNYHIQSRLWQSVAVGLLVWLMSVGFAFGQLQDERKLELVVQTGHVSTPEKADYSPDGKFLASGGGDKIIVWDTASGRQIRAIENGEDIQVDCAEQRCSQRGLQSRRQTVRQHQRRG